MNASFFSCKSVKFGNARDWSHNGKPRPFNPRSFDLIITDHNGERHDINVYMEDPKAVPEIDSTITGEDRKQVGDWLTDDIDGINLELPPMPDEND